MAIREGLFDSTTITTSPSGYPQGDKAETADFFADIIYRILGDGVSLVPTSAMNVITNTGMIVTVKAGVAFKRGYKAQLESDLNITFTTSASEQVFYIGVRLDEANGEFTGNNVVARTAFVAESDLAFAKITIPANAVVITDAMIEDLRYNSTYCGFVDTYRISLANIYDEFVDAMAVAVAGGIPAHATNHASGAADAITPSAIGAQAAMTAGIDYTDPATLAKSSETGVYSGGAVTAQGTPDQTVAVSAGEIITPVGKPYSFSAVSALAATAADATNPRIDIVYVSATGVVTYLAGTAAASPSQPATPANGTLLAAITRAANDNTIATADIADRRDFITVASDFEDVNSVAESSNTFTCNLAKKHTKNFSFSITNATGKTVTFSNVPYGTCDVILTIKATGTAAVTWTLDGRALVWPNGAPTLTSGYTYLILFTYSPLLGKWMGFAQAGGAN